VPLPTFSADADAAWAQLRAHGRTLAGVRLHELFAADPLRFERLHLDACGLLLDYSKARIDNRALELLLDLAAAARLETWIEALFSGAEVNSTERRAALHPALRRFDSEAFPGPANDVMPAVRAVRERLTAFAETVRAGRWTGCTGRPIEQVVNIGIGGSDLGPRMVCTALEAWGGWAGRVHFVANVDATELSLVLAGLDPAVTLFVVTSKTFTTQETLCNARSAKDWLIAGCGDRPAVVARHMVAVTGSPGRAIEFGADPGNIFEMWDWVGGRYSLWSAVGLPILLALGSEYYAELLAGAHAIDEHFRHAPPAANMPVLLALVGLWHGSVLGAESHAILPYDFALRVLPAYLQQLEMESNGKRVRRDGRSVDYPTCPVVWGGPGNNGQHAFFQLLHQGGRLVSSDFLVAAHGQRPLPGHDDAVVANALAQSEALMRGRTLAEARAELIARGLDEAQAEALAPHRVLPGNQPSNTLLFERLTPAVLGALLALYEHKVFVQSVCWGINPFDQWGVELGKELAGVLLAEIEGAVPAGNHDASTTALVQRVRSWRASTEA